MTSVKKVPKNILSLSKEEKLQFINSFDIALHDCDGVLWTLTGGLPGVKEGIEVWYQHKKEVAFVTNNSVKLPEKYEASFKALGVHFDYKKHLVHPAASIVSHLKSIQFEGNIFLIGCSVLRDLLAANGYNLIETPEDSSFVDFSDLFRKLFGALPKVDAVVMDVDLEFSLSKMYLAEYLLQINPDCKLLFGASDPLYMAHGKNFTGMGRFMKLVEEQAKQKPVYLGKPGEALGAIIVDKFKIKDKSRVLFVGDTLEQDIGFAQANGFQTLLVLSGVTTLDMLQKHEKQHQIPDYYANSLFDLVQFQEDLAKETSRL